MARGFSVRAALHRLPLHGQFTHADAYIGTAAAIYLTFAATAAFLRSNEECHLILLKKLLREALKPWFPRPALDRQNDLLSKSSRKPLS
jgi:hypothetical protein